MRISALPPQDQVLKLLQEAKERIAIGWIRSKFYAKRKGIPRYCAVGAIDYGGWMDEDETALLDGYPTPTVRYHARLMLQSTIACNACSNRGIVYHNDFCLKKQVEAIDWFERAIIHCKNSTLWK